MDGGNRHENGHASEHFSDSRAKLRFPVDAGAYRCQQGLRRLVRTSANTIRANENKELEKFARGTPPTFKEMKEPVNEFPQQMLAWLTLMSADWIRR